MAAEYKVKQYLAYWFQVGKRLICPQFPDGYPLRSVLQGDRYSQEFEDCWSDIRRPQAGDCYLEGMAQTIQDLLTSEWEIVGCARCEMPVPVLEMGMNHHPCPCSDLELWPNFELPRPRSPVNSNAHLMAIHARLLAVSIAVAQTQDADRETGHHHPQPGSSQPTSPLHICSHNATGHSSH